jgi:hypothetical protein
MYVGSAHECTVGLLPGTSSALSSARLNEPYRDGAFGVQESRLLEGKLRSECGAVYSPAIRARM